MRSSWADFVVNSAADNVAAGSSASNGVVTAVTPSRDAYVPPHLRNVTQASEPSAPAYSGPSSALDRSGYTGNVRAVLLRLPCWWPHVAWNNTSGGWDRRRDWVVNPFEDDVDKERASTEQENTGINFDVYEDIPVETSGNNVPPRVNTFAEIDLGEALNQNIKRRKYVKPTPMQRHAILISLAGGDLMACAQTGSGKPAAFCFPIISGTMKGQALQRPLWGWAQCTQLLLFFLPQGSSLAKWHSILDICCVPHLFLCA